MNTTFEKFYKSFGFEDYPFSVYTAEKEQSEKLFIQPREYSLLESTFKNEHSMIISGDRGTGKTIILQELKRNTQQENILCFIDNFETVNLINNQKDYLELLLKSIVDGIMVYLINREKKIKNLSQENKILLSFLIYKYGDNTSANQIRKRIEQIQLSALKRCINKGSKFITQILNYGASAITTFGNELLTKHFGQHLPTVDETLIKSIFPDINFEVDDGFFDLKSSYELINKVLHLSQEIKVKKVIVFIDKLDEDMRLENDAEAIANFIEPLFSGNQLLLNTHIQLIIAVWKIPFSMLESKFRRHKHFVYDIQWNYDELKSVLNHRIKVYSAERILGFNELFAENITDINVNSIFRLANSNPRDLWHIFHYVFRAQYNIDANISKLSNEAIVEGIHKFVSNFGFYEYYPKRKNSRKNSNDIYSYIQHLLKLNSAEFTHSDLETMANTGGSTTNYITGMMNIGVIDKTSHKRNGSVLYSIKDPKIVYALENGIDIEKS